jgi:hypothetical protein
LSAVLKGYFEGYFPLSLLLELYEVPAILCTREKGSEGASWPGLPGARWKESLLQIDFFLDILKRKVVLY